MCKDAKNICHNIRFHLGEYPHVSAKMCLGECADGSQIGRTYGLMCDFGVPPPPQSRRRLYMVPLRIRANWSCAGAKNETHGACHCHAMLLAQNREELQFIFATPASAPPVFLVRRSCVHLGCSPNGVMTNRPRFGRRSGTIIIIASVRSLMC